MEQIVVDFLITDQINLTAFESEFEDEIVIKSSAFSGTELIAVIISATAIALDKILNFYIQKRKTLKETTIKLADDEIELSGFTDKQILEMIQNGSLKELKKLISKKNGSKKR